jgi:hypothetical protein
MLDVKQEFSGTPDRHPTADGLPASPPGPTGLSGRSFGVSLIYWERNLQQVFNWVHVR